MARVGARVAVLNVPSNSHARRYLRDQLDTFMGGLGYLIDPDRFFASDDPEYINDHEDDGKSLCQIAAVLKAGINAIHTPTKIWLRKVD